MMQRAIDCRADAGNEGQATMQVDVRSAPNDALADLITTAASCTGEEFTERCRAAVSSVLDCELVGVHFADPMGQLMPLPAESTPAAMAATVERLFQHPEDARAAAWETPVSASEALASGIVALLPGPSLPLGVLYASTARLRTFAAAEISFVASAAALQSSVSQRDRLADAQRQNDSRLREVTDIAPMLIWIADPQGRLAFFNQRLLTFTGRRLQEQVADGWAGTVHPDDLPAFLGQFQEAIANHGQFESEVRLRDAAGAYRWFLNRAVPALNEEGRPSAYIGSSIDITVRRRAMDALRAMVGLGAELSSSLDQDEIAAVLARFMVNSGLGEIAIVALGDADSGFRSTTCYHTDRYDDALVSQFTGPTEESAAGDAAARAAHLSGPAFVAGRGVRTRLNAVQASVLAALGCDQVLGIPLIARGRTVGALLLIAAPDAPAGLAADLELVSELARRAALAIDNASLYAESQRQGALLKRSNDALQFLANAGVEFSRLLQDDQTMQRVAELAIPTFADATIIDIIGPDGDITRRALAASTPRVRNLLRQVQLPPGFGEGALARELRGGHSSMISRVRARHLRLFAQYVGDSRVLAQIAPESVLFIPMTARGQVLGLITFIRLAGRVPFTSYDLVGVGDQLGRRAGLSVDNARLFAESRAREAQLREANVAKDEFLGLMSHELRTPITVINGGARVLQQRGESLAAEDRAEITADIAHEAGRLAGMLEDMLALARVELNQRPVLEPILLHRLIEQLATDALPPRRKLLLDIERATPPVAAESAYVDHVFRNLISNAAKYSPDDSPIEVAVVSEGSVVAVRVLDHGPGVPPGDTERIFERFYRAEHTSRLASGAGMGLAVCKRLVEAMSGQIWAVPREGGGLEVGFSLPLYQQEDL